MWAALGWGIPIITACYGLARDLFGPSGGWVGTSIVGDYVSEWVSALMSE